MIVKVTAKIVYINREKTNSYTTKDGTVVEASQQYIIKFLVAEKNNNYQQYEVKVKFDNNDLITKIESLTVFDEVEMLLDIIFKKFGNIEAHEIQCIDINK